MSKLKIGDQIIYVPRHAKGDTEHESCEKGFVMGKAEHEIDHYFCRFYHKPPMRGLRTTSCSELVSRELLEKEVHTLQNTVNRDIIKILGGDDV
jgi:hypothetical protein